MRLQISKSVFFTLLVVPLAATPAATMLSVKLVKAEPGRCTAPPRLEFPTDRDAWQVADKPYHNGENDWEVFFEIETDKPMPEP